MGRKKKIIFVCIIFILFTNVAILLRYLIFFYQPYCFKDWEGDPNWEPPQYYKEGIADSKVEECARYAGDNIEFSQCCNGKYRYIYDAENDVYDDSDYNIVRHAGTTYAILDLYKELGEEKYLSVGLAGLEYLLEFTYKINLNEWAINYNTKMKVGTVSLAILGMVKYWQATGNERYNIYVEKFANFIVSQQRDDGAFAGVYGKKEENLYYSGEAFFALAMAYDMLEKKEYLKTIEDALEFYWSSDYDYDESAFIPWASSGCAKWYRLTDNKEFRDFCFEMTDIQITRQYLGDELDELGNPIYGCINGPTVNTAVYLEGIGDALRIAKSEEDTERINNYQSALKAGIEWVLSLQFRKEKQLGRPIRGYGGFHRGFVVDDAYLIRIDYTQHAISAILRVLREFSKEEIESIEIRNGKVDFKPKKSESFSNLYVLLSLIIAAIVIPCLVFIHYVKKYIPSIEILKPEKKANKSLKLKLKKKRRDILNNFKTRF
ncbi:MAG: hypothetical protein ACFFDK_11635 [Promethearchaeota archaeon]